MSPSMDNIDIDACMFLYVRCLKDLFRCTDYIPVPSSSRAGPLKSGSGVRRAGAMPPTQDSAAPEGSVPPGANTTWRATHFAISARIDSK